MLTACIRYTFNLDKVATLKAHVEAEQEPILRSGGQHIEYFLPTDFAGPTNEAMGLIDFPRLTDYERYRATLANDPDLLRCMSQHMAHLRTHTAQ
jgi:hypothetical protein